MSIPEGVKAGLIEAGGCIHTPEPWKGCDSCGRPIAAWILNGSGPHVAALDWQAVTIDGAKLDKKNLISIDNLPLDEVTDIRVATTSPRAPVVRVAVDPRKGEEAYMYTKHHVRLGIHESAPAGTLSVVVIEVTPDPLKPDQKVRLYVHPHGLVLSTRELYF